MLVAPQALKSVLPVEDTFSDKEMLSFSRIRVHQSTSETQVCEAQKQSQLLSTTSPLWLWQRIRLVTHIPDKFLSFLCCGTSCFKNDFITVSKRTCFIFQPIFPHFPGILVGQRAQRPISLPPVIALAISSIVLFYDT